MDSHNYNEVRPVLVFDMGAQNVQLIARRVREAHIYSEIVSPRLSAEDILAKNPLAIIISGGPSSAYAQGAPTIDPRLLDSGVPILGICYGFQLLSQLLGGRVEKAPHEEYGRADAQVDTENPLFYNTPEKQIVWMSHGDSVTEAAPGVKLIAETESCGVGAFTHEEKKIWGVQWHPEVHHSVHGTKLIENFLYQCAGLKPNWTSQSIIDMQVEKIRKQVGDAEVICGLSGGVDSSVAAALVHKAIGDQLTCIFVDHGLLRAGEREQVEQDYAQTMGIKVVTVDESERFLTALAGVTEPEAKRKIIGREFIRSFEAAQLQLVQAAGEAGKEIKFLVQGTLYPDVVESGGGEGAANIKSHHNVGGLPEDLNFELIEPLRELFKDEVRQLGLQLGVSEKIVWRQPFPGPGLGIRVIGELSKHNLDLLRAADLIVREELTAAGLDRQIWQCPVVLLADVRSVGVQGDARTYGHPIVIRPVTTDDAMTADWFHLPYDLMGKISNRITNEVPEINRVMLDCTSKPPGTIEWE